MHGKDLVVDLGGEERVVRPRELDADEERLEPAHEEEEQRGRAVQQADPLVVHRGDPAPQDFADAAR